MLHFVPYYRVSSLRQGRVGFGLRHQQLAVISYLLSLGPIEYSLGPERIELTSAKSIARRPELRAVLDECRLTGATLLISRLRGLRRDGTFLRNLYDSGVNFVACDMPQADRRLIKTMAQSAEANGDRISVRTKTAMASAKSRGKRFGNGPGEILLTDKQRLKGRLLGIRTIRHQAEKFALELCCTLELLADQGIMTASEVALALNDRGIATRRGRSWSATQVQRVRKVLSQSASR